MQTYTQKLQIDSESPDRPLNASISLSYTGSGPSIYLKAYEIAMEVPVMELKYLSPTGEVMYKTMRASTAVMSSFNRIGATWAGASPALLKDVLRGEWGFLGTVITDWWMQRAHSPEFPQLRDNAYRVRAGVDVLMPGDMGHTARSYRPDASLLETVGRPDGLTRGELERTARRVLRLELALHPPTADGAD